MAPGFREIPKHGWRRSACWTLLFLFCGLGLSGWGPVAANAAPQGKELFEKCVPCHGSAGQGNKQLGAPNIGGMKAWYVVQQLHKFRSGIRGSNFKDIEGMRMGPMARSLDSDQDVQLVAKYVESLPVTPQKPAIHGDVQAGSRQYRAICTTCHGPSGRGNPTLKAPRLAGVADWYLARQLRKFQTGVRGADPRDTEGSMMAPMSKTLTNDAAIRNVVAYIDSLKP